MGAWDYGPFDNDDASNFWYMIRDAKDPVKTLEKYLNNDRQGYENERRAAANFVEFLLRFDRKTLQKHKKLAVAALKDLKESDFVNDWNNVSSVKKQLNKEIKALGS